MLLNRLEKVIHKLISVDQAAFVRGRSLSDHVLVAQEVYNKFRWSKSKGGLLAIKLDMEQAYDSMGWDSLRQVLIRLKFPPKFMELLLHCVLNPKFCILINGKKTDLIDGKCGFRQGCPLSPFLFILCSQILSDALCSRISKGISVSRLAPKVSHLLFADDLLIFSEAKMKKVKELRRIINNYCHWTGQKVKEISYLGIKMDLRRLNPSDFQNLLDSAARRLNTRGSKNISLEGRLILSKGDGSAGIHYISWGMLCKPKCEGGRGLFSAISKVGPLRGKFAWNFLSNPNSVLSQILRAKYGEDIWSSSIKNGCSPAWKIITLGAKFLRNVVRWRISNGESINWMYDSWILDRCIAKWPTFVNVYNFSEFSLSSFILDGQWNFVKLKEVFGVHMIDIISNIPIDDSRQSDWLEIIEKFSGKSITALASLAAMDHEEKITQWNWKRKLKLKPIIDLFWWRFCNNALPTYSFLVNRKLSTLINYPRGCEEEENNNHIAESKEMRHSVNSDYNLLGEETNISCSKEEGEISNSDPEIRVNPNNSVFSVEEDGTVILKFDLKITSCVDSLNDHYSLDSIMADVINSRELRFQEDFAWNVVMMDALVQEILSSLEFGRECSVVQQPQLVDSIIQKQENLIHKTGKVGPDKISIKRTFANVIGKPSKSRFSPILSEEEKSGAPYGVVGDQVALSREADSTPLVVVQRRKKPLVRKIITKSGANKPPVIEHNVVQQRRLKGSIFFIGESSGKKDLFSGKKIRSDVLESDSIAGFEQDLDNKLQFDMEHQQMVNREEVVKASFRLPSNISSKLDGITASFFKNYWDIMCKDVVEAILEFFVSDLLSKAIVQFGGDGLGVSFRHSGPKISHLLYADDIILFSVANYCHLKKMKEIINLYCLWTGQRINTSKSMVMFSRNTPLCKQYNFSKMLGMRRVNSFEYLGLKCSLSQTKATDFNKVISKVMNWVNSWGSKMLSDVYGDSLDVVISRPRSSWRILQEGWRFLKPAIRWRIGDGASVSILKDVWIFDRSLLSRPSFFNISINVVDKVEELIEKGVGIIVRDSKGKVLVAAGNQVLNTKNVVYLILPMVYDIGPCFDENKDLELVGFVLPFSVALWSSSELKVSFKDLGFFETCMKNILIRLLRRIKKDFRFSAITSRVKKNSRFDAFTMSMKKLKGFFLVRRVKKIIVLCFGRSKLAWNYIQKPNSLFHCAMKAKYGSDVMNGAQKKITSTAWQILLDGGRHLKMAVRWKVVKGDQINILNDTWLLDKCINRWPTYVDCDFLDGMFVQQLLLSNGEWNFTMLQRAFHPDIILLISQICIEYEEEDRLELTKMCSRKTVSALKLKLNKKVEIFWWRLGKSAIPTNLFLKNRRISENALCARGCQNRNDVKHGKTALPCSMVASNALFSAISKSSPYLTSWGTNLLRESQISWCPPPKDWIKVNVDASLLSCNSAGIVGVFRDHKGRFISAFGKNGAHWDIAQLELEVVFTVREFLRSWMLECKGLIIESDNTNIIKFIQESLKKNKWHVDRWPTKDLCFLNDFNKVVFLHAYRSCNKVANYCATMALESSFFFDSFSFKNIPSLLLDLIKEECDPFITCN
ncbi:hypothetical protein KFK09_022759 [Dendrobium nobile]|uniref:Reverse transcriptase domain-containing protein n=1 Tax=Dendrobium nobile TaxID=94219 RepID=A0A8T3AKU3_DENNO|nr:hypothetical protein KFK09_022759 [Dendrobium nobile]